MIKLKKRFTTLIIYIFLISNSFASVSDAIFATVGGKAITQYDIVKEIKKILILSGQSFNENMREELQQAAINSAIKRSIKKIEIEKYESLNFNPNDLREELDRIAKISNLDLQTLKKTFVENEISWNEIVDQVKTELLWNTLIFKLYKDRLSINHEEIEEQLKLVQGKKAIKEYLISEIIIKSVPQIEVNTKIEELKNRIKDETFEKVAIDVSISETSVRGGNLGWINEKEIAENFRSAITNTPVGNISKPIILNQGILIFKVRDVRDAKKFTDLDSAKTQLVNAEKTKILQMHSLSHYDKLTRTISVKYFINQ